MELIILKDIVIIFALSTLVNLVFSRIRVPTVVGYLLTGIIAGPHLLSFVDGKHEIEILAEIGVIFLLFTIGIEFSLKHLLRIRRIVFLGGLLQVSVTAGIFYTASSMYGIDWKTSLLIGFLVALSSSALVLKLLQERSELTSNYGRTILGILIFQDLLLVPLLLFVNMLGGDAENIAAEVSILSLKAVLIIAMVYIGNKWLLPKLLHLIALAKNQELFMMSIFLICLSIALLTYSLGMSLAFGAFLAGLMISESEYSHNAFANLIPFKDTFTSFFFVSIGMLLDISFVLDNYQLVLTSVLMVLVLKSLIAGGTGFFLGHTFRGVVLVGMALCQVGEFSFILAKSGLEYGLLSQFYYQLFLAVTVISMALTPLLIKFSSTMADQLLRLPLPGFLIHGIFPLKEIDIPDMRNHLVIIGKDSSALMLSRMARHNNLPHASIVFDPLTAREKINQGDTVVYGDAVNEPILLKAHVDTADIVVVSIGSIIPSMAIIERVRQINANAFIIARAAHMPNVEQYYKLGADLVLPEKLEIAIDLFQRVLMKRLYPNKEVKRMLAHTRNINLGEFYEKDTANKPSILDELPNMHIEALKVEAQGEMSLARLQLRQTTGVTVLAIRRGDDIIEHPVPDTVIKVADVLYVLGNPEQINLASELFSRDHS